MTEEIKDDESIEIKVNIDIEAYAYQMANIASPEIIVSLIKKLITYSDDDHVTYSIAEFIQNKVTKDLAKDILSGKAIIGECGGLELIDLPKKRSMSYTSINGEEKTLDVKQLNLGALSSED